MLRAFFATYLLLIVPALANKYEYGTANYWVTDASIGSQEIKESSEDFILRYGYADDDCTIYLGGLVKYEGCLLRSFYAAILEDRGYCLPDETWVICSDEVIIEQFEQSEAHCRNGEKDDKSTAISCRKKDKYTNLLELRGFYLKDGKWISY